MTLSANGKDISSMPDVRTLSSLFIVKDNRKINVYYCHDNLIEVAKSFRGAQDFEVCKETVFEQLKNADKSCAYLTYKTVDKTYVNGLADQLETEAGFSATSVYHNKAQKNGKSIIGIYYYRG